MNFHDELMFPSLTVADRDHLFEVLGGAVVDRGLAKDSYVEALKTRELEYPTGLPISGGVAIPHTSAEYVSANTIVAATLTTPVEFAEMGGDEDSMVPVSTVFLLVLADSSRHVTVLSKLIVGIQDQSFVDSVRAASVPSELTRLLAGRFAD